MSLTFIDTNTLSKKTTAGHGDVTEILTESLCGAPNVHGSARWLKAGGTVEADMADRHHLIELDPTRLSKGRDCKSFYDDGRTGVYLGPRETATIRPAEGS